MAEMEFPIRCELIHDRTVNWAVQQNQIPSVKRLRLTNTGQESLSDLQVRLSVQPAFALTWTRAVDRIPPGATLDLGRIDLELDGAFLGRLTGRVLGTLTVTVAQEGQDIYSAESRIEVLPDDEWSGLQNNPQLTAAFVLPNYPAIAHILTRATQYLKDFTGNPSLDGYQSKDRNRVRMVCAAIYESLRHEQISYAMPPPSFEEQGQRVRLPDAILTQRLGTCFDLALLYAACIEAAGLHPLLIFLTGHAFAGAWLVEDSFPESIQDDPTLLTRRLAPGVHEITLVETTRMTSGGDATFDQAAQCAEDELKDPGKFVLFLDVSRAREMGIRPLPMLAADGIPGDEKKTIVRSPRPAAPAPIQVSTPITTADQTGSLPRLQEWERRLLDLSLRNPLLNFRYAKRAVPLLATNLTRFQNSVSAGIRFQILEAPAGWVEGGSPDAALQSDLALNRLRADTTGGRLPAADLSPRLTKLYRAARTAIEETGSNTLYLALGMLHWYEDGNGAAERLAPILLMPVQLVRSSAPNGYELRHTDEEPQINTTLLEMLDQDFRVKIPGVNPLPLTSDGVDVSAVLTAFRQAIMKIPRWDVKDEAVISLFSFSKSVMWQDIHKRSEALRRSVVVESLVSGRPLPRPSDGLPVAESLDATLRPGDVFCPVSADSSQLAAIATARQGHSFVLHGPPGTGKSQTITNMIADALGSGKTVLFVAEKLAALSVVHERLEKLGLGAFCLELHSNKSRKRDVLNSLGQALQVSRTRAPQNWSGEAERLAAVRGELNRYCEAIHRERPAGLSIYEALARLTVVNSDSSQTGGGDSTSHQELTFPKALLPTLTAGRRREWMDLVRQLRTMGEACGHPHNHPWQLSRLDQFPVSARSRATAALQGLASVISRWVNQARELALLLGLTDGPVGSDDLSYADLVSLAAIAQLLLDISPTAAALLQAQKWEDTRSAVELLASHGRSRDAKRSELFHRYQPGAIELDVKMLRETLLAAKSQWLLQRWLSTRRVTEALRRRLASPTPLSPGEMESDLAQIERLQDAEAAVVSQAKTVRELVGEAWPEEKTNWDGLVTACEWATKARRVATLIGGSDLNRVTALRTRWAALFQESPESFGTDGDLREKLLRFTDAFEQTKGGWAEVQKELSLEDRALTRDPGLRGWLPAILKRVEEWQIHLSELPDWCVYRRVRGEVVEAGLGSVVTLYEEQDFPHGQLEAAFEQALLIAWIEQEIDSDPALNRFSRPLIEDTIRKFREMDDRYLELTRQEIIARLASRVPDPAIHTATGSEISILKRQLLMQRGQMSLRALFGAIPNLLPLLKPCLLMSPISAAQYLDPAHPAFDLVIFDEASQVPTCDAVGALARGKNAIIVGDPKQLPPTSFFKAETPDGWLEGPMEDNGEAFQDLESILDDCLVISLPEQHLRWHYRSRHEGLIAFSNCRFYDYSLLTFPSPDHQRRPVQWRPINGVYDRGASRQNRIEAEAVVEEVARRLMDPTLEKSIGVITFSSAQQAIVEDLLDEQRQKHPEIEGFFGSDVPEAVFVKNLENVQGDERDVILFSIGYGPDPHGRVTMNFGPLNLSQGWRRLNVAVSRSRTEMVIFSSLRADQIGLSQVPAQGEKQGVSELKSFLEYVETGRLVGNAGPDSRAASGEGLENHIADELRKRGHTVHTHVGHSGYRLDLAVEDPNDSGRYLLGIECDGEKYREAKTARDRDALRHTVLKGLGWSLHRVWALEWWSNPKQELERIEAAIASAAARAKSEIQDKIGGHAAIGLPPRAADPEPATPRPASVPHVEQQIHSAAAEPADEPGFITPFSPFPAAPPVFTRAAAAGFAASVQAPLQSDPVPAAPALASDFTQVATPGMAGVAPPSNLYKPALLPIFSAAAEYFYTDSALVLEQVATVIEQEGPISFSLLCQRVARAWGMQRTGSRIEKVIGDACMKLQNRRRPPQRTEFLWPRNSYPGSYREYRLPGAAADSRRDAKDIPPEEIANAAVSFVKAQVSLPENNLVRELASMFGFSRTGAQVEAAINRGISLAITNGRLARDAQGRISCQG